VLSLFLILPLSLVAEGKEPKNRAEEVTRPKGKELEFSVRLNGRRQQFRSYWRDEYEYRLTYPKARQGFLPQEGREGRLWDPDSPKMDFYLFIDSYLIGPSHPLSATGSRYYISSLASRYASFHAGHDLKNKKNKIGQMAARQKLTKRVALVLPRTEIDQEGRRTLRHDSSTEIEYIVGEQDEIYIYLDTASDELWNRPQSLTLRIKEWYVPGEIGKKEPIARILTIKEMQGEEYGFQKRREWHLKLPPRIQTAAETKAVASAFLNAALDVELSPKDLTGKLYLQNRRTGLELLDHYRADRKIGFVVVDRFRARRASDRLKPYGSWSSTQYQIELEVFPEEFDSLFQEAPSEMRRLLETLKRIPGAFLNQKPKCITGLESLSLR